MGFGYNTPTIEKWKLDSWNKIKYSFPRAHSASYVLYAYRKAYYKAHYPDEFYKVINSVNI
jgi:DNA polymerase-3 subunit alpha (Gram-positive type)